METKTEHYRYNQYGKLKRYRRGRETWEPNPKGGKTEVRIWRAGKCYVGIADCNKEDNFCYRTGRWIATYRAVIQLPYYEAVEWPGFNILRICANSLISGNKFSQVTATILLLEEEKEEREQLAKELAAKMALFGAYTKMQAVDYSRVMAMIKDKQ